MNSSPERYTFQKEGYINRCEEKGVEPNPEYIKMYESWKEQDSINIQDTNWQKDNMEYDLRNTKWICDKAKGDETYAQHLYAIMCNREFTKNDVWPILTEKRWSCSWRSAGGIVANMREEGDYMEWYCSGIGSGLGNGDEDGTRGYVPEGFVTDEIREDLFKLGWIVCPDDIYKV
jgi:hypothetical protein